MMKIMLRDKNTRLGLVNKLIKLNGFNDLLSLAELTKQCIYAIALLEITYVSVKCKSLQGESGKANSLSTYYPIYVHG